MINNILNHHMGPQLWYIDNDEQLMNERKIRFSSSQCFLTFQQLRITENKLKPILSLLDFMEGSFTTILSP